MKTWVVPVRDVETQSEHRLVEAEVRALCGRLPRKARLPVAVQRALGIGTREVYRADLAPGELHALTVRAAYVGALVTEGVIDDGTPAAVVRQVSSGGHRYSAILPFQRVYEGTALSSLQPQDKQYVDHLLSDCWHRVSEGSHNGNGASPLTRKKNDYLSHPIHKYKAKFFPRLCRALINVCGGTTVHNVLDPMAGSGTTLAEASLLGLEGIGFDIDPLSVMISRAKTAAIRNDYSGSVLHLGDLTRGQRSLFGRVESLPFRLPRFVACKLSAREVKDLESESAEILRGVGAFRETPQYELMALVLSHAISTKICLRWMGTGDNRFSISLAKRELRRIAEGHLQLLRNRLATIDTLTSLGLIPRSPPPRIQVGDARTLPLATGTIHSVVTSPPYLPAASGRETYLRSRASALMALGLMSEEEVVETEARMLGTILQNDDQERWNLPQTVVKLVDWMRPQRARAPKAIPTLHYFESLRTVLQEIQRVLRPGGKCAIVLSARHYFYELLSRKTVRVLDMAEIVSELATHRRYHVGLSHEETIEIVLPKMDFAARPASRHEYAEAVLVLSRKG